MAQTFKYLDLTGLTKYDELIKNYISTEITTKDTAMGGRVKTLEDWKALADPKIEASDAAWKAFLKDLSSQTPAPTLAEINTAITTTLPNAIATAKSGAEATAKAYTDARETAITTAYEAADVTLHNTITGEIATAKSGAISEANSHTATREAAITKAYTDADTALETSLKSYADQAEADAKSHATDLNTAMDARVKDLESYKTTLAGTTIPGLEAAIEAAETNANTHTNTEIGKLNATTLKMSATDTTTIASEITSLKNSISGGTFFKGVVESKPTSGEGYQNGDIVIFEALEYIWDSKQGKWVELGDSSANAQAITNLGTRIDDITITGDTGNTYVDVSATKSGDDWTLTVDESKLSTKITALGKADEDNLAAAKKHATDLVEALDATFERDATGAGTGEVSVVTGVNLTQEDGLIKTFTIDSGKAATKTYVDNQITDAKKHATDLVEALNWNITDGTTTTEAKFIGGITVTDGKMTANSINTITSIETASIEELFAKQA
jgi:hypothetical protein